MSLKNSITQERNDKGPNFNKGIIREIDIWNGIKVYFNQNLETDSSFIRKNKVKDILNNMVTNISTNNSNNVLYTFKIPKKVDVKCC